jgi:hypothetical protein
MPAAFQVGRSDSSVDAFAECYRVTDVTIAEQVWCGVAVVALPAQVEWAPLRMQVA